MYEQGDNVMLETDDQCYDCLNKMHCPFMQSLGMGIASLNSSITVEHCHFYKPVVMKVLKGNGDGGISNAETTTERTGFSPKLVT